MNIAVFVPDDNADESWRSKGDINKVKEDFQSWEPRFKPAFP